MEGLQRQLSSIPVKHLYLIGGLAVLAVAGVFKLISSSKSKPILVEKSVDTRRVVEKESCNSDCQCSRSSNDHHLNNPYTSMKHQYLTNY